MGLGKRRENRQQELWIAADQLARTPRHVFYEQLNRVLAKARFDAWVEERCRPYYAEEGRRSIPPGVYFRMLLVGYFEGIDSQRGIAWRCADSRSLQAFLGYGPTESTPEHSSLTKIRERLPVELYAEVFQFVLTLIAERKLLSAKRVGVDSTTLEANAAMKSIVRKETGENWNEYVAGLMRAEGLVELDETPSAEELRRYDKKRKGKKVSNDDWENPHDPDAKITKLKNGRTHLAYKAEHTVDLDTEVILGAEIYGADQADTATLTTSLQRAQEHVDATETGQEIEKVAADKGYHAAQTLVDCRELEPLGVTTYIPEPAGRRKWTDKSQDEKSAVLNNRSRTRRDYGKKLQRLRSERVERSFAHVCDTGGGRRTWVRGLDNVRKLHLVKAAAHNLGLILRKLLGAGKPRAFAAFLPLLQALQNAQVTILTLLCRTERHQLSSLTQPSSTAA
jgi:transposase